MQLPISPFPPVGLRQKWPTEYSVREYLWHTCTRKLPLAFPPTALDPSSKAPVDKIIRCRHHLQPPTSITLEYMLVLVAQVRCEVQIHAPHSRQVPRTATGSNAPFRWCCCPCLLCCLLLVKGLLSLASFFPTFRRPRHFCTWLSLSPSTAASKALPSAHHFFLFAMHTTPNPTATELSLLLRPNHTFPRPAPTHTQFCIAFSKLFRLLVYPLSPHLHRYRLLSYPLLLALLC